MPYELFRTSYSHNYAFIIIFLFHNVKKTFSKRRMPDDRLIFIVAASIARFRECV